MKKQKQREIQKLYFNFQDPPERPKGYNSSADSIAESLQLWRQTGESCPEGTVPIRRTTEQDILRASSVQRFGRKPLKSVRRDSTSSGHEVSNFLFTFFKFLEWDWFGYLLLDLGNKTKMSCHFFVSKLFDIPAVHPLKRLRTYTTFHRYYLWEIK